MCYLRKTLDVWPRWAHPSMCLTLSASVAELQQRRQQLPRLTVVVGRVLQSEGTFTPRAHSVSFAPVSLLSDMIIKQQLSGAASDGGVEPLNCPAAERILCGNARRSSRSCTPQGGVTAPSLFDIPLWSE